MSTDGFKQLHKSEHDNGLLDISRETYIDENGILSHELAIWRIDSEDHLVHSEFREYEPGQNYKTLAANLDSQWKSTLKEFHGLCRRAREYAVLKADANTDLRDIVAATAISHVAHNLLKPRHHHDEMVSDDLTDLAELNTTGSQRFNAVRRSAQESGIRMDAYEDNLLNITDTIREALNLYDEVVLGAGYQPDHDENRDEVPRHHHDDDDDDDDKDKYCEADDDTPAWQPEDADAWKRGAYQESVSIPANIEDRRERELESQIMHYLDQLNGFMENADAIWLHAAQQIYKKEKVTIDPRRLEVMKYWMGEAQEAYEAFKQEAGNLLEAQYELIPMFEALEDPEIGIQARMQQAISMAGRPELLADAIRKEMPKQRGK